MKYYVCNKCGEFVQEDRTFMYRLIEPSNYENEDFINFLRQVEKSKNTPESQIEINVQKHVNEKIEAIPPKERYHTVWGYAWQSQPGVIGGGGPLLDIKCGPMHEENEQEYFVRWCMEKK